MTLFERLPFDVIAKDKMSVGYSDKMKCSWCKKENKKLGIMKHTKTDIHICKSCYDAKKYRNLNLRKDSFRFP